MKLNKKNKVITVIFIILVLVAAVIFAVVRVIGEKKANIIKILPNEADVRISGFCFYGSRSG